MEEMIKEQLIEELTELQGYTEKEAKLFSDTHLLDLISSMWYAYDQYLEKAVNNDRS